MSAPALVDEMVALRSDLAQSLFHVEGKQLSLANYPMYLAIYDGEYNKILLKTGRQVAKSTTIACFMIAETIGAPHFKTYYVSPSQEQTRKFSHTRISKILAYSPELRRYFVGAESIDNVLLRMLRNGSEMAFTYALDDPDRARGYSADRCCFDANAEVLTRVGWKKVSAVTLEDEVADVNSDGVIEWNRPVGLIRKSHTGTMVTFTHRGMTLRVTGDHKMWVNYSVKTSQRYKALDAYSFETAEVLAGSTRMGFKMTNRCTFPGKAPAHRILPGAPVGYSVSRVPFTVPYKAFASFVGWYLSEGHLTWRKQNGHKRNASVVITQNESRYSLEIEECLDACGFQWSKQSRVNPLGNNNQVNTYVISHAQLGAYCADQGLCRDKFIPAEFFEYPDLVEPLLRALYAGDASYHSGEEWDQGPLRTRSRQLADDTHRAWAVIGRAAVVHTRMMPPREGAPPEPLYEVQAYKNDYAIFWRAQRRVTSAAVKDEEVYCFTVKNHRPLVRGGFGQRHVIAGQCFDEVQDILFEPVIPVIEECMSNSPHAYSMYCGTPKTMENTIEFLWALSSQTEWCIKCDGCGKSTFIDSIRAIGKTGPICLNPSCGRPLNPRNGRWFDMKPYGKEDGQARVKGFHISQVMMPENVPAAWKTSDPEYAKAAERWDRILFKMENWGDTKFLNECLGVSTSTGARLLTKDILESLCDPDYSMTRLPSKDRSSLRGITRVVAGVDWSGGGAEVKGTEGLLKSRTVMHIWGDMGDGRLKTLFYKIFPNGHPIGWIDEIVELANAWNVQMLVGDAGEGAMANSMLKDRMGAHRVTQVRYMALSKPVEWNPNSMTYHADRTTLIDNFAMYLTHGLAVYPNIPQSQPAITDILNVYEEVTTQGRKVWRHSPTAPDDCLHAALFGWFAWKLLCQDLKFYT